MSRNAYAFVLMGASCIAAGTAVYLCPSWAMFGYFMAGIGLLLVLCLGGLAMIPDSTPSRSSNDEKEPVDLTGWGFLAVLVAALVVSGSFVAGISTPTAPKLSREADKIAYSLKTKQGWKATEENALFNESAELLVYTDGTVKRWPKNAGRTSVLKFNKPDTDAIAAAATQTRAALCTVNLK